MGIPRRPLTPSGALMSEGFALTPMASFLRGIKLSRSFFWLIFCFLSLSFFAGCPQSLNLNFMTTSLLRIVGLIKFLAFLYPENLAIFFYRFFGHRI